MSSKWNREILPSISQRGKLDEHSKLDMVITRQSFFFENISFTFFLYLLPPPPSLCLSYLSNHLLGVCIFTFKNVSILQPLQTFQVQNFAKHVPNRYVRNAIKRGMGIGRRERRHFMISLVLYDIVLFVFLWYH